MSAQGNVLGLIHVEFASGHADELGDRARLLSVLADQLALALANLKLRDSLRDQSIRDHLTGLHNRRFLEESLERDVARAQRTGQPLAVLMLDADHFKRFNDQFGHEAGDRVLSAIGKAIKESCRRNDLACRFGGEEFTVVLSDVAGDAAMQWAERLLAKVRKLEVKTGTQSVGQITLSAGVALCPEHGEDVETLLRAADAALYQAKHSGRDRVVGYAENPVAVAA
jgi:diguanylate cyclase (GGDEF)-like protein